METTRITVIIKRFILLLKSQNSHFVLNSSLTLSFIQLNLVNSSSNYRVFAVLFCTYLCQLKSFIAFLNIWETDLQKSMDFLLNPFFCISKRSVCELIVLYVVIQNEIKV